MYDAAVESTFRRDVVAGLSAPQKALSSKYFYDAAGDALFQQIMACPEYYLSRAEAEILVRRGSEIVRACAGRVAGFDIVELGAGDATKTEHLLRAAVGAGASRQYFPIDISPGIITFLQRTLPERVAGLRVTGMAGEYFPALARVQGLSRRPKLVLFMGATVGNWPPEEARVFLQELGARLAPGDLLLLGVDLKKHPAVVLAAYDDAGGLTRAFNLNLLRRINAELGADFDLEAFGHYPTYDPATGACKSFLVSERAQTVRLGDGTAFAFAAGETIYMEVSQKYGLPEIQDLGAAAGFAPVEVFLDSTGGFADVLWQKA